MSRRYMVLGAILCIGVGIVVYLLSSKVMLHEQDVRSDEQRYTYLPDFTFPNENGEEVTFAAIQAPLRIVNFWASWSPYSRDELPALASLKRELGDAIEVVALNRDINPADGRAFLAELGLTSELTFAYDSEDTYFKKVGGYNMPETVFVGREGEVLEHSHGPMSMEAMRTTANRLLEGT